MSVLYRILNNNYFEIIVIIFGAILCLIPASMNSYVHEVNNSAFRTHIEIDAVQYSHTAALAISIPLIFGLFLDMNEFFLCFFTVKDRYKLFLEKFAQDWFIRSMSILSLLVYTSHSLLFASDACLFVCLAHVRDFTVLNTLYFYLKLDDQYGIWTDILSNTLSSVITFLFVMLQYNLIIQSFALHVIICCGLLSCLAYSAYVSFAYFYVSVFVLEQLRLQKAGLLREDSLAPEVSYCYVCVCLWEGGWRER